MLVRIYYNVLEVMMQNQYHNICVMPKALENKQYHNHMQLNITKLTYTWWDNKSKPPYYCNMSTANHFSKFWHIYTIRNLQQVDA